MFRIFLTNLGKYNEGELVGEWVDLPIYDFSDVLENIGISDEPAENGCYYEEYFITDFETDYNITIGEYDNIYELDELAERLEGLTDYEKEIVKAYCEVCSDNLEDALDHIDDCIFYQNCSLYDVAVELADETLASYAGSSKAAEAVVDFASSYFDYNAFARDLGYDGYYEASNGVICVC